MGVVIDENIFPPDIDSIQTVRVAVATDLKTGKQGVLAMARKIGDGTVLQTPIVWADDARDKKNRKNVEIAAREAVNSRVDIVEFVRKQ